MVNLPSGTPSGTERASSCLFTGHRDLPKDRESIEMLRQSVSDAVVRACASGYTTFYAGGAVGFDMLASLETLRLRDSRLPEIKLILVVPYFGHYRSMDERDRASYAEILRRADGVVYLFENYVNGCMQSRNRYMVDRSSRCICFCLKSCGGTAFTVRCAQKSGLTIDNLAALEDVGQISLFDS